MRTTPFAVLGPPLTRVITYWIVSRKEAVAGPVFWTSRFAATGTTWTW